MKVKKIAALAVGAAMVGATLGMASAQPTVPEIPKDFFVKDGMPNAKIVVGSQGAALDVASAADIAVAIGSMLYTEKEVQANGTSVVLKKDIAYDPDDIEVFNNYYIGMTEEAFMEPSENLGAWEHWYGVGAPGGEEVVNVTLNIDGDDYTIPIGDTVTVNGHDYTPVRVTEDGILILDVDGTEYALKEGEMQVLDVNYPGYLKLPVEVDPADLSPFVQMDIHTEPDPITFKNVDSGDTVITDADDIQLQDDTTLLADLTVAQWTDYEFTFNATDVNVPGELANITINWSTPNFVNDVELVPTAGSVASLGALGSNGIQLINVTVGDLIRFYTDDGIFDFQVIEFGYNGASPYVRLNFLAGEYDNYYQTNSFPKSDILDLQEAEAQYHVSVYVYEPATITFRVLDVDTADQNVKLEIDSTYYDGDRNPTEWTSGQFIMLELEQQHIVVPTIAASPYYGDVIFDLYVDYVSDAVTSVPLTVGDSATLRIGESLIVGSFNFTVVSADPIADEYVIKVTDAIPTDGINVKETYLTLHSADLNTLRDIPFTTSAVIFESKQTIPTYTGYGYGAYTESEWDDGSWDKMIQLPISGFAEWSNADGDWTESATIEINRIKFEEWEVTPTEPVPPSSGKLLIPAGDLTITIDFGYGEVTYYYNDKCGFEHEGSYTDMDLNDVPGARVGDVITFKPFEKTVSILEIGDNYFTYGQDLGTDWYRVGDEKQFGNYVVKVLDINIFESKVLLQVSEVGGTPEMFSVQVGDTLHYEGLYITVDDAFIGATEDVIAKLTVKVEEGKIISDNSDYTLVPGYITKLVIGEDDDGKYIDKIIFISDEDFTDSGEGINVFNTYLIKYVYEQCSNTIDDETRYAIHAYVAIDPYKPIWYTQELEVGDMLYDENGYPTGWIVDKINAQSYNEVTIVPPTEPITVLDTEIMEAGLDSVDSNLILIGGPVVNSVTAALAEKLGVPSDYEGWEAEYGTGPDSGVIKYVEECGQINGYGVVLVAGTDREGTKAAAEALMEYLAGL